MQTVVVPVKTFEKILSRLDQLTKDVQAIKSSFFEKEPPYGSDAWWKWSDKKAKEDIKAGRYITLHSTKEAQKYLNSLKSTS